MPSLSRQIEENGSSIAASRLFPVASITSWRYTPLDETDASEFKGMNLAGHLPVGDAVDSQSPVFGRGFLVYNNIKTTAQIPSRGRLGISISPAV